MTLKNGNLMQLLLPCQCYNLAVLLRICACFFSELAGCFLLGFFHFYVVFFLQVLFCELLVCNILWNIYAVSIYVKHNLSMFLGKFAYIGLVYPYLHFLFNLLVFILFKFLMKCILGLFFSYIAYVRFILSDLLACFRNITCDHCSVLWWQDKLIY